MDNKSRNTVVLTVVIFLLLLLSGILFFKGRSNKKELFTEKQTSQALLEKSDRLKKELTTLQDDFNKNSIHMDQLIKEKELLIDENNAKVRKLLSENKSGNNALKQVKEIEVQNSKLQTEINTLKEQLADLTKQSQDQSGRITDLEQENSQLKEQNTMLRSMISNNIKITATKGRKNKLTVMAARTNLISAYLDVPASVSNNVSFTLTYPDGTKVSSKEVSTAIINVVDPSAGKATENTAEGYTEAVKTLELKYTPKVRLKKGTYKLSVYNESEYITGVYIGLK